MQKPFLLLVFSFFLAISQAQTPWSPMHPDMVYTFEYCETYNYNGYQLDPFGNGDFDLCYHSFWIDSSWTANGDTIFQMNNPLGKIDSIIYCDQHYYYFSSSYQWYVNGNHFLQQQIIKKSDNEYHFVGLDIFVLQPQSGLNDSWAFALGITATVVALKDTLLWSEADSLKTIQLSNGEIIQLSRNYGILQFPHPDSTQNRTLAGWEKDSLHKGIKIPDVMDFYNFEVGDVFMYTYIHTSINGSFPSWHKKYILGKQLLSNGYQYVIQRISRHYRPFPYSDVFEQSTDTVEFTYSNTFCNSYPLRFDNFPSIHRTALLYNNKK